MRFLYELMTLMLGMIVLLATPTAADNRQSHSDLVRYAIDGYALPRLERFTAATGGLQGAIERHCVAPGTPGRQTLVERFRDSLVAWAGVEVLRMGPASEGGRAQRIAFWPDPRGALERQIRAALAERNKALVTVEGLSGQSAALQGLPALELLIADTAAPMEADSEDGRYRCGLAVTIARNVARLAAELRDGWTKAGGWRDRMLGAGPDNPSYATAGEAAADMVKSLLTGLQAVLEFQIKPRLETAKDGKPRPGAFPYRRLGLSKDYLRAGLAAGQDLYAAMRLDAYLTGARSGIGSLIGEAFRSARAKVDGPAWIASPADLAQRPAGGIDDVRFVSYMIGQARRLIATQIAPAAGVTIGFNELDGD